MGMRNTIRLLLVGLLISLSMAIYTAALVIIRTPEYIGEMEIFLIVFLATCYFLFTSDGIFLDPIIYTEEGRVSKSILLLILLCGFLIELLVVLTYLMRHAFIVEFILSLFSTLYFLAAFRLLCRRS